MYNRELITFITVADRGSFLKAAKELYITPASGRSIYQDAKKLIEFAYRFLQSAFISH